MVHLTQGSNNLHFFYGADGSSAIVEYNGVSYGYVKNLQGDVIAIVNASGTKVVEYAYDAWGRLISKTGSLTTTLGTLNPFRYRGYVYDEETGLYCLRSRYYNPVQCRFICPDVINTTNNHLLSCNLFAYCINSPVMRTDVDGTWGNWFAAIVTVAVSVVAAALVIAAAPVIAGAAGATAIYMGVASLATTASIVANVTCAAVAGGTILCGVNRGIEAATGTNYGEQLLGEIGYGIVEDITYGAATMITSAPSYLPYPSTGRTQPANLKEQMKYHYAIEDGTKGKLIIPYLKGTRMPGWMGWQKYSINGDGVDIHHVGHRFLPVRFDYKIK